MIEWINIDTLPKTSGYYLIKYREYLGVDIIYGFKISKYDHGFDVSPKQIIEEYATIPLSIPWKF